MFGWVLNTPLLPVKNKERNYLASKTLWPLLWTGFNCLKATEPLKGEELKQHRLGEEQHSPILWPVWPDS